jgi:hypothetical protein
VRTSALAVPFSEAFAVFGEQSGPNKKFASGFFRLRDLDSDTVNCGDFGVDFGFCAMANDGAHGR